MVVTIFNLCVYKNKNSNYQFSNKLILQWVDPWACTYQATFVFMPVKMHRVVFACSPNKAFKIVLLEVLDNIKSLQQETFQLLVVLLLRALSMND